VSTVIDGTPSGKGSSEARRLSERRKRLACQLRADLLRAIRERGIIPELEARGKFASDKSTAEWRDFYPDRDRGRKYRANTVTGSVTPPGGDKAACRGLFAFVAWADGLVDFKAAADKLADKYRVPRPSSAFEGGPPPPAPKPPPAAPPPAPAKPAQPLGHWERRFEDNRKTFTRPAGFVQLAQDLGMTGDDVWLVATAAREAGTVLSGSDGRRWLEAVTPMRDGEGRLVGGHRRLLDPKDVAENGGKNKKVWPGSGLGLMGLSGPPAGGLELIFEGPSDWYVARAGGLPAVSRPMNHNPQTVEYLAARYRGRPDVVPVVVGENDRHVSKRGLLEWPGREGAERTAQGLADALNRPVTAGYPPGGAKDLRAYVLLKRRRGDGRPLAELVLDFYGGLERLKVFQPEPPASPAGANHWGPGPSLSEVAAGGGVAAETAAGNGLPAAAANEAPAPSGVLPEAVNKEVNTLPHEVKNAPKIEKAPKLSSSRAHARSGAKAAPGGYKRTTSALSQTSSEIDGPASAKKEAKPPPKLRTDYVPPVPFDFGSADDLVERFGKPRYCRGAGLPWWFGYVLDPRAKVCALPMCKNPHCPACWPRRLIYSAAAVGCALDDNKDKQWGFIPSPDADFSAQREAVEKAGGVYVRVGKGMLTTAGLPGRQPLTVKQAWQKNLDLHKQLTPGKPRERLVKASQNVLPPSECGFHQRPQRERLREVDRGLKAANAEARAAAGEIDAALEDEDGGRWRAAHAAKSDAEGKQAGLKVEKNKLLGKINVKKLAREERSDASLRTVERRAAEIKTRDFTVKGVDNPELCGWSQAVRVRHGDKVPQKVVDRDTDYLRGRILRPAAGHPFETAAEARERLGGRAGAG
jgi:hypothetical protein